MSAAMDDLLRFARGEVSRWTGLGRDLSLSDLQGVLAIDDRFSVDGELGSPPAPCSWVVAESELFDGGLRIWVRGSAALVVQGVHPLDDQGEFGTAPDLGEPDGMLDSFLGPLRLEGGERVFADRGLALRVNPANGLLLELIGFAPTTFADYVQRLRPVLAPTPLVPTGGVQ